MSGREANPKNSNGAQSAGKEDEKVFYLDIVMHDMRGRPIYRMRGDRLKAMNVGELTLLIANKMGLSNDARKCFRLLIGDRMRHEKEVVADCCEKVADEGGGENQVLPTVARVFSDSTNITVVLTDFSNPMQQPSEKIFETVSAKLTVNEFRSVLCSFKPSMLFVDLYHQGTVKLEDNEVLGSLRRPNDNGNCLHLQAGRSPTVVHHVAPDSIESAAKVQEKESGAEQNDEQEDRKTPPPKLLAATSEPEAMTAAKLSSNGGARSASASSIPRRQQDPEPIDLSSAVPSNATSRAQSLNPPPPAAQSQKEEEEKERTKTSSEAPAGASPLGSTSAPSASPAQPSERGGAPPESTVTGTAASPSNTSAGSKIKLSDESLSHHALLLEKISGMNDSNSIAIGKYAQERLKLEESMLRRKKRLNLTGEGFEKRNKNLLLQHLTAEQLQSEVDWLQKSHKQRAEHLQMLRTRQQQHDAYITGQSQVLLAHPTSDTTANQIAREEERSHRRVVVGTKKVVIGSATVNMDESILPSSQSQPGVNQQQEDHHNYSRGDFSILVEALSPEEAKQKRKETLAAANGGNDGNMATQEQQYSVSDDDSDGIDLTAEIMSPLRQRQQQQPNGAGKTTKIVIGEPNAFLDGTQGSEDHLQHYLRNYQTTAQGHQSSSSGGGGIQSTGGASPSVRFHQNRPILKNQQQQQAASPGGEEEEGGFKSPSPELTISEVSPRSSERRGNGNRTIYRHDWQPNISVVKQQQQQQQQYFPFEIQAAATPPPRQNHQSGNAMNGSYSNAEGNSTSTSFANTPRQAAASKNGGRKASAPSNVSSHRLITSAAITPAANVKYVHGYDPSYLNNYQESRDEGSTGPFQKSRWYHEQKESLRAERGWGKQQTGRTNSSSVASPAATSRKKAAGTPNSAPVPVERVSLGTPTGTNRQQQHHNVLVAAGGGGPENNPFSTGSRKSGLLVVDLGKK